MLYSFCASALAAVVLLAGPISCSPENKSAPASPFHPPLPKIEQGHTTWDLHTWDERTIKELSPTDLLDVREARAARVEVQSVCQENGLSFSAKTKVNGDQPIPLFQVLPEELLLMDLGQKNIQCVIQVSLWNEARDRHNFDWHGHLIGAPDANARLERQGRAVDERELGDLLPSRMGDFRLRFQEEERSLAHLACSDFSLPLLEFNHSLVLDEFDASAVQLRPGRPAISTELHTRQNCRIFIERKSDRRKLATSPRFVLNLSEPRLRFSAMPIANENHLLTALREGKKSPLVRIQIHNPSLSPRRVRLTGSENLATDLLIPFGDTSFLSSETIRQGLQCTGGTYIQSDVPPDNHDKTDSTWSLAAGQTLTLELSFRTRSGYYTNTGLRLKTQLLPLTELDMDNHVIHHWHMAIPDTVVGNPTILSDAPVPRGHSAHSCL